MSEARSVPKPGKQKKGKAPGFDTPASYICMYCGMPGVPIERHHVIAKGMGGTKDPEQHSPKNRIDLCVGPGTNDCHGRAQRYEPGYLKPDLLAKKERFERVQAMCERMCP